MDQVNYLFKIVTGQYRKRGMRGCCLSGSVIMSVFLDYTNTDYKINIGYGSLHKPNQQSQYTFRHIWISIDEEIYDCNWILHDIQQQNLVIEYYENSPIQCEILSGDTEDEKKICSDLEHSIDLLKTDKNKLFLELLEDVAIRSIFNICRKRMHTRFPQTGFDKFYLEL